jgi:hypothetical protein
VRARERRMGGRRLRAWQRGGCVRRPDGHNAGGVVRTPIGAICAACAWCGPATRLLVTAVGGKSVKTQRPAATVGALGARIGAANTCPTPQQPQGRERRQFELIDAAAHQDVAVSADTDSI